MRFLTIIGASCAVIAAPLATAQILPWEITVAETEAGRIRNLAQRLNKQNLLYQLRLGDVSKDDVLKTAGEIDQILRNLEEGVPARSIPAPWTKELAERIEKVDTAWSPLRKIALANPYEQLMVARDYAPSGDRRGDPLLLKYFDTLTQKLVEQAHKLVGVYDAECLKTELGVCETARSSGIAAMLIERAAKEAIYVVAEIDSKANRKRLQDTITAYRAVQQENNASAFFKEALNPERSISARGASELLLSLRQDWEVMQQQFTILAAGDEQNFDLRLLLLAQNRMVDKVERLTAALVRYANLAYGA